MPTAGGEVKVTNQSQIELWPRRGAFPAIQYSRRPIILRIKGLQQCRNLPAQTRHAVPYGTVADIVLNYIVRAAVP